MPSQAKKVPLAGSYYTPVAGSHVIGPAHPDQRIEVTVQVRPRAAISPGVRSQATSAGSIEARRYLTREQLAADYGASDEDIAKVVSFAQQQKLVVVATSARAGACGSPEPPPNSATPSAPSSRSAATLKAGAFADAPGQS